MRKYYIALLVVLCSTPSVPQPVFTITEKAPTRAFSWLKVPTSAITFKTLCSTGVDPTVSRREIGMPTQPGVVGAFSVIVKTGCRTDGVLHSTNQDGPRPAAGDREPAGGSRAGAARGVPGAGPARHIQLPQLRHHQQVVRQGRVRQPSRGL